MQCRLWLKSAFVGYYWNWRFLPGSLKDSSMSSNLISVFPISFWFHMYWHLIRFGCILRTDYSELYNIHIIEMFTTDRIPEHLPFGVCQYSCKGSYLWCSHNRSIDSKKSFQEICCFHMSAMILLISLQLSLHALRKANMSQVSEITHTYYYRVFICPCFILQILWALFKTLCCIKLNMIAGTVMLKYSTLIKWKCPTHYRRALLVPDEVL